MHGLNRASPAAAAAASTGTGTAGCRVGSRHATPRYTAPRLNGVACLPAGARCQPGTAAPFLLLGMQELLDLGFSFLATGTDLGLLGEAAAKNAAFAGKLREGRHRS